MITALLALSIVSCTHGFSSVSQWSSRKQTMRSSSSMSFVDVKPISYSTVVLSGFLSKGANFADPFPFLKLHEKDKYDVITALVDDLSFAKKRLASPETVYSGLFDIMDYAVVNETDESSLEAALVGKEAWISFNISSTQLLQYATLAAKLKLPRVVFGVRVGEDEQGPNIAYESACELLAEVGTNYTIWKFGDVRPMGEGRHPYRIRRGNESLPLPSFEDGQGQLLSSKDLLRVIVECVDLVKSFNRVYCIGPGTFLDAEILTYMKAQGWPERVQVGTMMGDIMDGIERKYEAEKARVAALNPVKPPPTLSSEVYAGQKMRSTGFFT